MADTILKDVHVDRENELKLFRSMVGGDGDSHILLIQAESGMGKTSLLGEFWRASRSSPRSHINLKRTTYSVEEILTQLVDDFGGSAAFPTYSRRLEQDFARAGDLTISGSRLRDVSVHQTVAGPDRELRQGVLTDALLQDLRDQPLGDAAVVIFDTYEEAGQEVKDWLSGRFLRLARTLRWLVIVIAGQRVPEPELGWDEWSLRQTLRPLDPEHVSEYLDRVELRLTPEQILVLYEATEGRPFDLATAVARIVARRMLPHE